MIKKFMIRSELLLLMAGLVLGLASGYWAGLIRAQDDGSHEGHTEAKASSRLRRVSLTRQERGGASATSLQLAKIVSRPRLQDHLQGLIDRYDSLTASEFEAEAMNVALFKGFVGRERIIANFLLYSKWGEKDPIAAFEHSNTLKYFEQYVKSMVFQGWAAKEPAAAAKYFQDHSQELLALSGGSYKEFSRLIAGEWARQNPDEALKWTKTLSGKVQLEATIEVFKTLSATDPAKAAKMAIELEGDQKLSALKEVASHWASSDWGATEAWISSLPADEQRAVKMSALGSLSRTNPEEAAQKVLALDDGAEKRSAMQEVAVNMAHKNPAAGVEFLMKNATPEIQAEGIRYPMQVWARKDAEAAGAWVSQLEQGAVRDKALASYTWNAAKRDPEQRLELASGIGDEQLRESSTTEVAAQWMRMDKEAASKWLNEANLSDSTKRKINEKISDQ